MRTPLTVSTSRHSTSASTRVTPMNAMKKGTPMIRIGEAERERSSDHGHREIENAGSETEQHEQQAGIGARVAENAEEPAERARSARLRRCAQGGGDFDFGVAVRRGDFIGSTVGRGDEFEHIGFRFIGVCGDLRAQIFLGVVQRILDQRGILILERGTQLAQIFLDRARGSCYSCGNSGFDEAIDKCARLSPDAAPAGKHGASFVRDLVVAARRSGVRRHDAAAQQSAGRQARAAPGKPCLP